jgi:hypothetical protein
MATRLIANSKGQSLIQVMISAGIMGILAMTFLSMMNAQQRMTTQLSQRLASLDLERSITSALADGTVCSYMLTNSAQTLAINPNGLPPLTTALASFSQIPMSANPTAPPLVNKTAPASSMSPSLFVSSITLDHVTCNPTLCTPASTQFNGKITVAFDSTNNKLIIPLAPLSFPVNFSVTGSGVNKAVSCTGGGGTGATAGSVTCNCPGAPIIDTNHFSPTIGQVIGYTPAVQATFYLTNLANGYATYATTGITNSTAASTYTIPGGSTGPTISGGDNGTLQVTNTGGRTASSTLGSTPNLPKGPLGTIPQLAYNNGVLDPNSDVLYEPPAGVGRGGGTPTRTGCVCPASCSGQAACVLP